MAISPTLGILIMMNNYFHDVATALLASSAFVLYAVYRVQDDCVGPGAAEFFLKTYRKMVTFARCALAWIVIGGIPRTIFYTRFEWANAAGKGQVPALIVKHILMVFLVIAGVWGWRKLKSKAVRLTVNKRT
ncbi:hypothetical protein [Geobacter grbiciae]|uniref:hypothetical protein n=1 Tax=Geobacter grbiciae TaxID=155042 RepID=UPI001C0385AD|nr:hypothetical protein [Geobacter grbiciae]MBT1074225.1 hypothetical protein [Geobacter grbiciae]